MRTARAYIFMSLANLSSAACCAGLAVFCNHFWGWNAPFVAFVACTAVLFAKITLVKIASLLACVADLFIFWKQGGFYFWLPLFALAIHSIPYFFIIKKLTGRKTREKELPTITTIKKAAQDIEKDLRGEYWRTGLKDYFDNVFSWLYQTLEQDYDQIIEVIKNKNVPPAAAIYALLFFQVHEQLKNDAGKKPSIFGHTPTEEYDKSRLWKLLFDKVNSYNYISAEEMKRRKKEATEWYYG